MHRRSWLPRGCLALAVLAGPPLAFAQVNGPAVADVASGKLKEARASWWGFDESDATPCLQKAIDSKVPKLVVDNVGKSWVVRPLKLVSNQEIVFEKGVEVLARAGEFKGRDDSLFTASLLENVTLSGYGATLRMRRGDYNDPSRYTRAEWRHMLQFLSCRNVKVLGLTLTESGGDGIYLGKAKAGVPNRDVLIRDVTCHRNYRQGISVITAEGLRIENTTLSDTAGTAPQAGIDFEPNEPDERIVNCVLWNCVARNNAGGGFVAYLANLNAKSAPVSLRLDCCKSLGNRGDAVGFITHNAPDAAVTGTFDLIGCELRDTPHTGIGIVNNPPSGCRIRIKDCSLTDTATGNPLDAPIVFTADGDSVQDLGGATFENVLIRDTVRRPPIRMGDRSGRGLQVIGIGGHVTLERDGRQREVELTKEALAEWVPATAFKPIPRVKLDGLSLEPLRPLAVGRTYELGGWRLRGAGAARVWAKQGERVTVTVNSDRVGNYAAAPVDVVVTSPSKKEVRKQQIPFGKESPVTFTAAETGLHQISTAAGANCAYFTTSTHPLCLDAGAGGVRLVYSTGTLYFVVPDGTREFGVRLLGEGAGEGVKATLRGPSGGVIAGRDQITSLFQFTVEDPQATPGLWSLTLDRPTGLTLEDYSVDLVGIPPLLAPTRAAALKP